MATVLITENLADLNRSLVESPYSAKIRVPLPGADDIREFVLDLVPDAAEFAKASEVTREVLADKLVGLSRVSVRTLVKRALTSGERITGAYLTRMKKELIEKEAAGRLEFLESTRTLDDVAGHDEAKAWLREDAVLLKRGRTMAIPMGYLLTGRIGTGKTYLVECLAGDIGIPCVEMKNFREKWVGATEGNLEKVFSILHALGQVIVFVDEADQMTGKRGGGDGDSGLSGRVYGMLAKEMSDTKNRGKIVWIFATSRPDLVEVDLKRQGRLDVHIPLFPPGDAAGRATLFAAMARKLKLPIKPEELPALPDNDQLGGNEMEGLLVRALRIYESGKDAEERGKGAGQAAARLHRVGDRGLPALRPRRAARAHGPARGEGVHRHALPAGALPQAEPRRGQRPHRAAQGGRRRVAPRRTGYDRVAAPAGGHPVSDDAARPDPAELQDALHVFGEYLSDKVAPLMAFDALSFLMGLPPAFAAQQIVNWCVRQVEVQGGRWRSASCCSTPPARST